MDIYKYARYSDLYFRKGVMDHTATGMEWMDSDFDSRTLRDLTESCTIFQFIDELLVILLIGTPNCISLTHSLGIFDWIDNVLVSKEIFNKLISKLFIYPLNISTSYKDELGRIKVELSQDAFYRIDALKLLSLHKLDIHKEDESEIFALPAKVKRIPLNEDVNMIVNFRIKKEIVTAMDIWYE